MASSRSPSEWTLGIKANTQKECQKRGLVFRQSAPLLARPSGLLFRMASAGLHSAYSRNGMLVGDSPSNFRASAVVSSRLSRDSPWSCRTDDRGLEELASRIEAVVVRGGGRCSCSHARGLRSGIYKRYVPAWSNLEAVISSSYLALACTLRLYLCFEYSK